LQKPIVLPIIPSFQYSIFHHFIIPSFQFSSLSLCVLCDLCGEIFSVPFFQVFPSNTEGRFWITVRQQPHGIKTIPGIGVDVGFLGRGKGFSGEKRSFSKGRPPRGYG
jgi:hypothetical protein